MIRLVLADDHAILREGVKSLLSIDPEFEVAGEASDGEEVINLASKLKPDVIVMDIAMPGINGLEATKKIVQTDPSIKILVLTQYDSQEYLFNILQAGAQGYVLKRSASTELITAIKTVYDGHAYLSPAMTKSLIRDRLGPEQEVMEKTKNALTPREQEILKLIAEGKTNQQIADILIISLKTVQTHRAHIMEKLDMHDRTELVKYAIRKGIISLEEPIAKNS